MLMQVPLEPALTRACEAGTSYDASMRLAGSRNVLQPIVERLLAATKMQPTTIEEGTQQPH